MSTTVAPNSSTKPTFKCPITGQVEALQPGMCFDNAKSSDSLEYVCDTGFRDAVLRDLQTGQQYPYPMRALISKIESGTLLPRHNTGKSRGQSSGVTVHSLASQALAQAAPSTATGTMKPQFKVGDKIRVLSADAALADVKAGDVGTITQVRGTKCYDVQMDVTGRAWAFCEWDIEFAGTVGSGNYISTPAPQSAPYIWVVGDEFTFLNDYHLPLTYRIEPSQATGTYTVTWTEPDGTPGQTSYTDEAITRNFASGKWVPVRSKAAAPIADPYSASPEIYRPGEAQQAAALASKRDFVLTLLGADEKAREQAKSEQPATNSVFECPYEAYDTKYGDW